MAVVAELQEQIMEALADGEEKTKPQLARQIPDLSGAHLASALRVLKRQGRVIVGSDGSKRVYRLPGASRG